MSLPQESTSIDLMEEALHQIVMQDSISIASESDEETASLEATVSHLSSTIDSLSNESIADVMEDDLSDLPSSSSPSPSTNENTHLNLSLFEGAIEGLYQHAHSVLEQAKESILLQKREEYEVLETEYATLLRGKQVINSLFCVCLCIICNFLSFSFLPFPE